jgi:hypothetical protein
MPAVTDSAGLALATFGEPPVDVSELYVPSLEYVVRGLSQEERVRPRDGLVIPTIAVSFTVPGHPGTFTIRIDNYAFTHVDVLPYIRARAWLIRGLYALPGKLPPFHELVPESVTTVTSALEAAAERAALALLPTVP